MDFHNFPLTQPKLLNLINLQMWYDTKDYYAKNREQSTRWHNVGKNNIFYSHYKKKCKQTFYLIN